VVVGMKGVESDDVLTVFMPDFITSNLGSMRNRGLGLTKCDRESISFAIWIPRQ
jgi:hypothetical protein